MKSKLFAVALIAILLLAACGPKQATETPDTINVPIVVNPDQDTQTEVETPDQPDQSEPAQDTSPDQTYPADDATPDQTYPVVDHEPVDELPEITVMAPSSTTSIPILLATKYLPGMTVEIFENHPQAHAQFMSEENLVLVTGLSTGLGMYKNEVPLKVINTNVTGLSYIVACNVEINSFADLKDHEIYLPFEGSPLEEATIFFTSQKGLTWGTDVKPIYAPFDTSTALIKEGKDAIVAIPQPAATAMAAQECAHLGPSFYDTWNEITGDSDGYPQVAAFAKSSFVEANPAWITAFNEAVAKAIHDLQTDPEAAVAELADRFSFPAPVLTKALTATKYTIQSGQDMKNGILHYYETIGKALDESFEDFFYTLP